MPLSPILACKDVSAAIDHYTKTLGFELAWQMPPNDKGEVEFAGVKLGDAEILLGVTEGFVAASDLDKRGTGVQIYINLSEDQNIDALYDAARAKGATITKEIETRDWGERAFTANDLDGYNLMFAQAVKKEDTPLE